MNFEGAAPAAGGLVGGAGVGSCEWSRGNVKKNSGLGYCKRVKKRTSDNVDEVCIRTTWVRSIGSGQPSHLICVHSTMTLAHRTTQRFKRDVKVKSRGLFYHIRL